VKGRGKSVVPFIKPWGKDAVAERLDIAREAGCDICGMDVDAAGLTILRTLAAPVAVKTPDELAEIIDLVHQRGMKFIVKGIMTVDEAEDAVDAGTDAVLVSNHGGRVLDCTPGTAEVLPEIAEAVGDRTLVMVDGGIRSGTDVLKVLALGAKAALVCRPVAVMLHGDEENGVPAYFAGLREELAQAMRLTGCKDLASIDANVVC
ncbi:MAG: alpha-hydroxy-acid oxidizing protein, partial [Deltaproteobacteria bacterium]|nr:alpha-hydroxy-acid oxidizing protein [Deltaproteobacteria bacterium]